MKFITGEHTLWIGFTTSFLLLLGIFQLAFVSHMWTSVIISLIRLTPVILENDVKWYFVNKRNSPLYL